MAREDCEKMVLAGGKSDYCVRLASNKIQYVQPRTPGPRPPGPSLAPSPTSTHARTHNCTATHLHSARPVRNPRPVIACGAPCGKCAHTRRAHPRTLPPQPARYVLVVNEGKGKILNVGIDIGTKASER